jgi:tetratricopeptide (TPR) repeat protein
VASQFKSRQRGRPVWTASEQRARISKALNDGRTEQALELAQALFKHEAAPEHLELVRKAILERARQLRQDGNTRDAATMLANAVDLGGPDFLKEVARELAHAGAIGQAEELAARLDDPSLREAMLVHAADAAMRQGTAGRNLLPEALRGQFDLIRAAFAHAEAGRDEAARASLQAIGLRSPFLEWKLFLRGLLAYYLGDDARALDNWNRLDSERLPFRLAGPLRFVIDPVFRQAQSPAAQMQLQKAADKLQGSGLAPSLRTVQSALHNEKQLPQAFRLAENLLPSLQQQAAALVPRLASCFYWAIITHGNPEDKSRYLRVFGAPTVDPYLNRMEALALEVRGDLESAHEAWEDFQAWLEHAPAWGSQELRQRARALVWNRMGMNADRMAPETLFPRSLQDPDAPPLPDAAACYRKSLMLAPDRLDAHKDLFDHYYQREEIGKAIKAGEVLLKRFPDHVPTLEALAEIFREKGNYAKAVGLLQRAVQANPLERKLRLELATAHAFRARDLAEGQYYEAARAEYQAAYTLEDPHHKPGVLCRWAACEFKAKNAARAEELLLQARQEGGAPAHVAYYMTIETIRYKLPPDLKKRFSAEFTATLAEPPTVPAALDLLNLAMSHALSDVNYSGRQTHEKKVFTYAAQALAVPWTEDELERLCMQLVFLKNFKLLRKAIRRGRSDFPASPVFPLKNALLLISLGPGKASAHGIRRSREMAQRLAEALPAGERRSRLFQEIHEVQKLIDSFSPPHAPAPFLEEIMDGFWSD